MTADQQGNLFIAHYCSNRVEVLDSTGTLIRRYTAGNLLSSNAGQTPVVGGNR